MNIVAQTANEQEAVLLMLAALSKPVTRSVLVQRLDGFTLRTLDEVLWKLRSASLVTFDVTLVPQQCGSALVKSTVELSERGKQHAATLSL